MTGLRSFNDRPYEQESYVHYCTHFVAIIVLLLICCYCSMNLLMGIVAVTTFRKMTVRNTTTSFMFVHSVRTGI